jgi:transposase-like protein
VINKWLIKKFLNQKQILDVMSTKCNICKNKIETTFLGKLVGTQVGKKYVCNNCQKKYKDKIKEMLK